VRRYKKTDVEDQLESRSDVFFLSRGTYAQAIKSSGAKEKKLRVPIRIANAGLVRAQNENASLTRDSAIDFVDLKGIRKNKSDCPKKPGADFALQSDE